MGYRLRELLKQQLGDRWIHSAFPGGTRLLSELVSSSTSVYIEKYAENEAKTNCFQRLLAMHALRQRNRQQMELSNFVRCVHVLHGSALRPSSSRVKGTLWPAELQCVDVTLNVRAGCLTAKPDSLMTDPSERGTAVNQLSLLC